MPPSYPDSGVPRWGAVVSFRNDSDNPLMRMWDCVEAYMSDQRPFHQGYTLDALREDLLEEAGGDLELLADFLERVDVPGWDGQEDAKKARRKARKQTDGWSGFRKLSGSQRYQLALQGTPFLVVAVRRTFRAHRQRRKWETEVDSLWELLIENPPAAPALIEKSILTLAPNPIRNQIMNRLAVYLGDSDAPAYGPVALHWKPTSSGRSFLDLKRC